MEQAEKAIFAPCPLYACRVCRTKTGWPHQRWCALARVTEPGCGDCRYHHPKAGACPHPA